MEPLTINIKNSRGAGHKVLIELNADKFERLAANFGFFGADFLKSLGQAENDCRAGRIRKVKSLRELRK